MMQGRLEGEWLRLALFIQDELADIEQVVARVERFLTLALQSDEDAYWDAIALNLHGFYSGVERILTEIAREIDEATPSGRDWHRALLRQMAWEVPSRRPAILQQETRECLDEYRRFRHIVRNVYTFSFNRARLRELAGALSRCYEAVQRDLLAFARFLERLQE